MTTSDWELWLDASRINSAGDGSLLATWSDVTGRGRDAKQAVFTKRPTYVKYALNGLPVVRFNGTQTLQTPPIDLTHASGITLYLVASSTSAAMQMLVELGPLSNTSQSAFNVMHFAPGDRIEARMFGDVGGSLHRNTIPVSNAPALITVVLDKGLVSREASVYINSARVGVMGLDADNQNTPFGNLPLNIGARNGGNLFLMGDVAELMLFSTAHRGTQRHAIERQLSVKWGLGWSKAANIVFDGDSITQGVGASPCFDYPSQTVVMLDSMLDRRVCWENYGKAGQTLFAELPSVRSQAAKLIDPEWSAVVTPNIYVLMAGTNDAHLTTPEQLYANMYVTAQERRAAGWKVLLGTLLDRSDNGKPPNFDDFRADFNSRLRNSDMIADGIIDFDTDPWIGANGASNDPVFFFDKLHLTAVGYARMAISTYYALMQLLLA